MARPLDDEARTELLCFLVVGQLFAFAREGVWLRTDHLIESAQIWLASNGAECDWLERARLVEASRVIARQESEVPFSKDDADLHRLFNLRTGWFLDYRSPVVQRLHVRCISKGVLIILLE
ncbi:hypothetical protein LMG27952_04917 [Paraburkholderia hiiakae]|uniref:Uncharacterized protein n=1 Tax=Paraburkholderia hiiakae TaxID=1081782 RepID=A0ABN7I6C9_9BURK|nr:hypothetical protein [Paraburkholderia hiiakae]CAD6549791.1 hypothetical protein LMG27952_04917 [Paraburkholderia hiiakae]